MKNAILVVLLILLGGVLHMSCGTNPYKDFENKVEMFGTDGIMDSNEWDELVYDIQHESGDRKFGDFITKGGVDEDKLENHLTKQGYTVEREPPAPITKAINIYIENSGSMFGFVNGNTSFKNVLTKLIVDLKSNGYQEEDINFHFINKTITPINISGKMENYPISLSSGTMRDNDSNDSDINSIYKHILENTSEGVVSILLSDCIYSVHQDIKNDDVDGALRIWKTRTVGVFNDIIKEKELSTILVQLTSDFTGNYYTKENKPIYLNKEQIPYYITVIGEEKALDKFDFVDRLDGYRNKLTFTTQDYSKNTFYSLIQTIEDNGDYKPVRSRESNPNVVQAIERVRLRGRDGGAFVFSLAVDFSKLPVSELYLSEKSNYIIEKGDYEIASILPFEGNLVKPNALKKLEQANIIPTHIFIFKSTSYKYSDLVFALKKNVPEWVYQSNSNDDADIKVNPEQTFGLKYLVEGVFEAYQSSSDNKDYITFSINIKK